MKLSTSTKAAKWAFYILAVISFMQGGEFMAAGNYFSGAIFAGLGSLSFALVMAIKYDEGVLAGEMK